MQIRVVDLVDVEDYNCEPGGFACLVCFDTGDAILINRIDEIQIFWISTNDFTYIGIGETFVHQKKIDWR